VYRSSKRCNSEVGYRDPPPDGLDAVEVKLAEDCFYGHQPLAATHELMHVLGMQHEVTDFNTVHMHNIVQACLCFFFFL